MKAMVYSRYGGPEVLHVENIPEPNHGKGVIRIHVRAVAVTSADARIRGMKLPRGFGLMGRLIFGVTGPRQPILGAAFSGTVNAVGPDTERFKVGDDVFGINGMQVGAYAEMVCVSEKSALAIKPEGLSHEAAAALPFGGTTAMEFLRRAKLKKGERILINGASGSVGCAMVQLARNAGAHVVGVCSGCNADLVRSLGAERVIDYTREDILTSQDKFDVVVDTVGHVPVSNYRSILKPDGRLLLVQADLPALLMAPVQSRWLGVRVIAGPITERAGDVEALARLAVDGMFDPVIDRTVPFEQIPDAHRYVDTGRKKGNVVAVL
ncbi:MAG TPA: NAD(P)-dependent alcohol dehydrogenase [Kiritimatiellia bacterium]|nr:NAD(P)-dependent alcohol dehydrogenase [Kiritimatiellia bacterium]